MLVVTTYIYTSCYRNINFIITKSVFSNHKIHFSNHKISRGKMKIIANLQNTWHRLPDRSTPQNLGFWRNNFPVIGSGMAERCFPPAKNPENIFFCGNCVMNQAKESGTNIDEKNEKIF